MAPRELSPIARRLIENAELVVGGARHRAFEALSARTASAWRGRAPMDAAFTEIVARRGRAVTVVASGDPFHYGVGKRSALVDADEIRRSPSSPVLPRRGADGRCRTRGR